MFHACVCVFLFENSRDFPQVKARPNEEAQKPWGAEYAGVLCSEMCSCQD